MTATTSDLPGEGWLTDAQARRLADAGARAAGGTVVEIGSFRGRSTIVLARAAGSVVSIDPHAGSDRGPQEIAADASRGADDHSTFLANLLPWWRSSASLVSVVASVAVFATAISMLALLGPWRRRLFGPLVVVCVATMIVLAGDVMTGSRLQISSLMGEQPVVGGRYFGMGNVTFALFATATLLLCTALGSHHIAAGRPRVGAPSARVAERR